MDTYDISLAPRFRQYLVQREAELRAIMRTSSTVTEDKGEVVDFKDVAAEQTLAALDDVKSDHAAHELAQVMAALRRLDNQSYGYCLDCNQAIDLRRLTALPAAPLCTSCQAMHEHEGTATTQR